MTQGEHFPRIQKGDIVSLTTFPGLQTRSTQVGDVTFEFPEPSAVIDVGYEIAERMRSAGDVRASDCLEAFREVAQALTGAAARLEVAVQCEQSGKVEEMRSHIEIAKQRLTQAGTSAEKTRQYTLPPPKQIDDQS